MEYEKLKKEVLEIAKIAKEAPEPFKEKCFEVLLKHLLAESPGDLTEEDKIKKEGKKPPEGLKLTSQLRVLMRKHNVTEDQINAVVMHSDNEVYFLRKPTGMKIARGQISWALLLALKSAILKNKFEVDPEDVRSVCIDKGYYDAPNFANHWKTPANASLFKGPMKPQGEPQLLSDKGEEKLANLIKSLPTKTQ